LDRFPDIAALADGPCDPTRPGIVHRLDRGTSGLLVVARTASAYEQLGAQMKARSVGRRYTALVEGHVADDRGVVDAPIGRSVRTPTRMAVTAAGRPSRTGYEVLARLTLPGAPGGQPASATLLTCTLETGRTHQIRVHLAAIGHPVAGDDRYGPSRGRVLGPFMTPGRLFLHAGWLAVDHPGTGERVSWESALPPDLRAVLDRAG
jgi:23S rRNA pseudouridine1911/1915/1917 synthase